MNQIDVLDDAVNVNGHLLTFPLSQDELEGALGEPRLDADETHGKHIRYIYDESGLVFEGSPAYLSNLKKKKAYRDNDHFIISLTLFVTGDDRFSFGRTMPDKRYAGDLTYFGGRIDPGKICWVAGGSNEHQYRDAQGKNARGHVTGMIGGSSESPVYDGDSFCRDVILTFAPERPKSTENYTVVVPDEECLTFDNLNFKLAVVNELMYKQEVLKPYFDIYDYMAFKKAHWNLESDKNIKAAVDFFKALPVPARLAGLVTSIDMDGSDEIYMNIAPEWDGEDDRFDIDKLSAAELRQFPNLRKMTLFAGDSQLVKLRKICDPLGIEIDH